MRHVIESVIFLFCAMCMIGGVKEEWDGPKMINGMMMSHGDEHPGAGVERQEEDDRVRTLRSARSVELKW